MVTIVQKQTDFSLGKVGHSVKSSPSVTAKKVIIEGVTPTSQENVLKREIFDKLTNVEYITVQVLAKNPILRFVKYRNFLSKIVEDIYGDTLSNETVPRTCRRLQNDYHLFKVDDTTELEEIYREYYGGDRE